jgi:hypothetical protein
MTLRRIVFTVLTVLAAVSFAVLVPSAAHAGSAARQSVPSPTTTLIPAVIVLAAIAATVSRMNRRGGPR